jgi:cytochrome c biogenesis protein CcdA
MQELMTVSINTHIVLLLSMLLVSTILVVIFFTQDDYIKLTRVYERVSLIYFLFLSMFVFTGLLAFTVIKFTLSFRVILMILATLYIIVTSVRVHRIFKESRLNDRSSQITFVEHTRKKYIVDNSILILVGLLSYAIHF